ncbi:MAG: sigma-54 dependent transcriptional regulator [Ignavibacteriaceae bacterium]|jgi:DNA-binding NtrC family response regulator
MSGKPRILIVDDEPDMLSGCANILAALGNKPIPVSDGRLAIDLINEEKFDLIFCDLLMPDIDGMQIVETVQRMAPQTPIIIFSAYGTIERAVTAMKAGAFDFIEKPFDTERLKISLEKGLRQRNFIKEHDNLVRLLEDKYRYDNIISKSSAMKSVFEMIESVSQSEANVLITGESGTGKELIARSIHAHSKRKTKPFVPVNCGAFPENLFEAELFGYEKGAFTGANRRKIGLLEFADSGTFFLDEICELPISLQVKMLRVLQDQLLRRVGGNELMQIDIRLISATNQDINKALKQEQMRKDFYYRLNVINIQVPPLRKRDGDITLLAEYFLKQALKSSSKEVKGFTDEAIAKLEKYNWPGNIRELENIIERAVALVKGNLITVAELHVSAQSNDTSSNSFSELNLAEAKQKSIDDTEKKYLIFLLKKHNGNVTKISEDAGMTRRNIHRILKRHSLDPNIWRV